MDNPVYQADTLAERRRFPRVALRLPVHYQSGAESGDVSLFNSSITHDLGIGGMAMIATRPLETGDLLNLTLFLPPDAETEPGTSPDHPDPGSQVNLLSRVIWRQHLTEDQYLLGVQFLDLADQHCERLKTFLRDYRLQTPDLDTPL
jgi:hypothetical protein